MFKLFTAIILLIISLHSEQSLISIKEDKPYFLPSVEAKSKSEVGSNTKPFGFFSVSLSPTLTQINRDVSQPEEESKEKVATYNTESEKVVGNVPRVAVNNSPALVACSDLPEGCEAKHPSPTVIPPTVTNTPTPTATPTPVLTIVPEPSIYPCPPPPCYLNKDSVNSTQMRPGIECPMYVDSYPCAYLDQSL